MDDTFSRARKGMMDPDRLYERYQDLQSYVGWTDEDGQRVCALGPRLEPYLPALIEDFYAEIARHPQAHKVFTGGQAQVNRLKAALLAWLRDLLAGPYDKDYVVRRWKVGAKHAEIGLDQVYTNAALSRLRTGLVRTLGECWREDLDGRLAAIQSLNKLLDLDLAKIEGAYQSEYAARLQRNERLATLGQIAGGVAHELRNPLNVVKTSVYYLTNARNPTPEKRAEHMQRIERSVEQADEVITTLSNFARMPVPALRPLSVAPRLREALADCAVPTGVEVAVDCPSDLQPAMADPGQIRIVLGNLIRNACEAMPAGGCLTLTGRHVGDAVEMSVADTGVGIAPADLGRVMEPLYSSKPRGLGLGLALSRLIVEKNQGSLHVVSEPGKGSTFTVRLNATAPGGDPIP